MNLFRELKRRNVYKVAVAYAVVAWLLVQAASILFPTFEAPGWVMKAFVIAIAAVSSRSLFPASVVVTSTQPGEKSWSDMIDHPEILQPAGPLFTVNHPESSPSGS